jgi:hypothetical protein
MLANDSITLTKEAIAEINDEIFVGNGKAIKGICVKYASEIDPMYADKSELVADVLLDAERLSRRFDEEVAQNITNRLRLILADMKSHLKR